MSNRPVRDDDDLEDSTEGDDEIRRYEEAKERELKRQEYAKANYALTAPSMDDLFVGYDSETVRLLSRAYRESHEYTSIGLTYGEIIYKEFHDMFTKIYKHGFQYQSGGFYVDIGAGSGKALFAGHLIHNFSRCLGIEILKPLQDVSNKVLTKWEKVIARRHPDWRESDIRFLCGDIKYIHSWTNADVVFAHFTCMEEDIKQHLAEKATAMRPGTFFITTTFRYLLYS